MRLNIVRAEYDRKNNRVVALEDDEGRVRYTGESYELGAPTEWVPVIAVYPPGYTARFSSLLHGPSKHGIAKESIRYTYDSDSNQVLMEFPEADFSPSQQREALRTIAKDTARYELSKTDWYVIRQIETGKPIPSSVVAEREALRSKADNYLEEIDTLPDASLAEYNITFDSDEPGRPVKDEPAPKGADGREWITDATAPGQEGSPISPVDTGELK